VYMYRAVLKCAAVWEGTHTCDQKAGGWVLFHSSFRVPSTDDGFAHC
jgi:hypothetical protein